MSVERIDLSECKLVKDESDIPGCYTSVRGEYFIPTMGRTGFYKTNESFFENVDLVEHLSSSILSKLEIPCADIVLAKDDERNDRGCFSMSVLGENEHFIPIDFKMITGDGKVVYPGGIQRFVMSDIENYKAQYPEIPADVLEERKNFLKKYIFISAFLGNYDVSTSNCQLVYNENTGEYRNPAYYDMGMSFSGKSYGGSFPGMKTDMETLEDLYSTWPDEIKDISLKVERGLTKEMLSEVLSRPIYDGLGANEIKKIWADLGEKLSTISKKNEILYGEKRPENSFLISHDELEENTRATPIGIRGKAARFIEKIRNIIRGDEGHDR